MAVAAAGLVLVGAAGAAYYFLRPTGAPSPPVTQAMVPPPDAGLPPVTGGPIVAPVPATPEPVGPVEEEVTMVPGATPRPRPSTSAPPSGRPSPLASAPATSTPGQATPALPVAPPAAAPPSAALVTNLLSQAQRAVGERNYDVAVARFEDVLRLDPQNALALQGRSAASAARTASLRKFVVGRTVVSSGKAKADLSGFDTADVSVQKAPDFSGRLELVMSPAQPAPGQPYTLQVVLVNEGKKDIKVSGMTVNTAVNGAPNARPMTPRVKQVAPQQRVVLEDLPGVWPQDVKTWSTEVTVSANKGESLKNQVQWR